MNRSSRITTRGDRIVVALAVVFVLSLYAVYWQPGETGTTIEYQTPNDRGEISLDGERELSLQGAEGVSHIRIHDGAVRFTASPCRNKHCIHSGWLRHSGDFATCLPNQVALLIHGPDSQRLDAINY